MAALPAAAPLLQLVLAASLLLAPLSALDVAVDVREAAATSSPFLASHGYEAYQFQEELPTMLDSRAVAIASHLSPGVVRVGGISSDWLAYDLRASSGSPTPAPGGLVDGYWPTAPRNISIGEFYNLTSFHERSNLSLMFDLSELYGRNCNTTKPGCSSCSDWCGLPPQFPAWDTSNVRAFLQRLHDDGKAGGANALFAFELGNELAGHLDPAANSEDLLVLSRIIADVWSDTPQAQRPLFFAPSTDDCWSQDTLHIMQNVTGAISGFTFHGYPAGDGHDLEQLLLNSTWLRSGIMTGSDAQACLGYWNSGPRVAGMALWVTEASSSWNWPGASDPPWPKGQPGQNAFMHGFFSIPQWGQYARASVPVVARWALALNGGFASIDYDSKADRFDVAADFWLMLAQKRLTGAGVLAVTGDEASGSDALVYAYCALASSLGLGDLRSPHPGAGLLRHPASSAWADAAGNGSVVIMAVNPSRQAIALNMVALGGGGLATTPRFEFVFTALNDDISQLSSVLNGLGPPLRVNADGSLPPLPGHFVPAGGASLLTLPPLSQAFFVLLASAAPACM